MTVMKEMQFPVSVRWRGGRLARADGSDKGLLELATPPEFRGGMAGYWSPEDLLVAAAASCFVLTLAAVAERREARLIDAAVNATGHMSRRADGRFGFTVIEIEAELETVSGGAAAVTAAAKAAEQRCLISQALDVPVHVAVVVKTVAEEDGGGFPSDRAVAARPATRSPESRSRVRSAGDEHDRDRASAQPVASAGADAGLDALQNLASASTPPGCRSSWRTHQRSTK